MTDTKCNGWTNYATWRINLELIDGINPWEDMQLGDDPWELAQALKAHCEEIVFHASCDETSLMADYALAFMADVNWHEIAAHLIEDYAESAA